MGLWAQSRSLESGLMIENQTTKLRGSRLTAWQARGLNAAYSDLVCFVCAYVCVCVRMCAYVRVCVCVNITRVFFCPKDHSIRGCFPLRSSLPRSLSGSGLISPSLSDLRFTLEALPGKPGIWLAAGWSY